MKQLLVNRKSEIANREWLPDMDLNHDKQIQNLLCYHYTIGQAMDEKVNQSVLRVKKANR
jgi:hypothetical protein